MKNDVQVKKKMGDVLCDIGKRTHGDRPPESNLFLKLF